MRIVFIAPELPQGPIAEHVRLLAERHDVVVGLTDVRPAGEARIGKAKVVAVEATLGSEADVAVATHWRGTVRLFEVKAERFVFWVDSFANQRPESEPLVSVLAYDLPVDFIAAATWAAQALEQLRPDARIITARNGAEAVKRSPGGDKLRVFVDDSTVQGTPGLMALKRMKTPHSQAKSLADADVALFLDPVDGVLDATLVAARSGVIPVVLPAGGQTDLVKNMESGIVGQPEDTLGVARSLDRLQADAALRQRLSAGAVAAAEGWPDWDGASKEFERALKQIASKAPPESAAWPLRLMADAAAVGTVQHLQTRQLSRDLNDERVSRSPVRRAVRKVKRSRLLTPIRIAGSRFVPDRIKKLG